MTNVRLDKRALEFVERYLDFLDGEGPDPDPNELPDRVREQAFQLLRVLDELSRTQ